MDTTLFQVCQKITLFDENLTSVFLAKRHGENDFDGVYSLIGGKLETTDFAKDKAGIIAGLEREKCEEIGKLARVEIFPELSWNTQYIKKNGCFMILPHYFAKYLGGEIKLNLNEYVDCKWVKLEDLDGVENKIESIVPAVQNLLDIFQNKNFIEKSKSIMI